ANGPGPHWPWPVPAPPRRSTRLRLSPWPPFVGPRSRVGPRPAFGSRPVAGPPVWPRWPSHIQARTECWRSKYRPQQYDTSTSYCPTFSAQFIGVCSSVDTCSKEEGRGKGRGEKAYKAIAEEQRALHSRGEAAYTVNGLQRG